MDLHPCPGCEYPLAASVRRCPRCGHDEGHGGGVREPRVPLSPTPMEGEKVLVS